VEGRRLTRLLRREGLPLSYPAFVERSVSDADWFYRAAVDDLGLGWLRPYHTTVDESDGIEWAHWFVGGGTNVAWLTVERWAKRDGSRLALFWEGDEGSLRNLTFAELDDEIARAAVGLRQLGIRYGDVVALFLPMIPEAVIAMLATARIGAIAAPCFSGFGTDALGERLRLAGAKVLVTADGTRRRGAQIPMLATARDAAENTPSVEHIVVVPRLEAGRLIAGEVAWQSLLTHGRDADAMSFDSATPWLLAFTSGSTGRPKGAIHTHGGLPYTLGISFAYNMDVDADSRFCWPTDLGWIVGPMTISGTLSLGATLVLFDSVADYPAPDRLWHAVERHGVTHLGMAPTIARMLATAGDEWVDRHALHTLRVLASSGEPWTLPAWRWLHRHVGRGRAPIINVSGGTEIGTGILVCDPLTPIIEGRFTGANPGMAVDALGEDGKPVVEEPGELVLTRSWPSMTRGFWNEPDRYVETYWSRWPGVWVHGDRAIRYVDGSWELPGRSDDLLKVAGKRIGPVEYESLATEVAGVSTAAAVGISHPTKGELPVVVVVPTEPDADRAQLRQQVTDRISDALGKSMRPTAVVVASALPMTRSGKVHRRAVRAWLSDTDPGDLSTVENLEAADAIVSARQQLPARSADGM